MDPLYCPFDIHVSRKDVFCLAFYLKWKYFVLIDYILSETICLFCFCVLFSNIYTKIKFTAKIWSDLCIFYIKVIFRNFCLRKYFYFLCWIWIIDISQQYCENFRKKWTSGTCWKSGSKSPTLLISAWFALIFTMGKSENIWFFKNHWRE